MQHTWLLEKGHDDTQGHPRREQENKTKQLRQASIEDMNSFVESTLLLKRGMRFDSESKTGTGRVKIQGSGSIDESCGIKELKKNFMKRRPLRFSRTLDLESTVKFCSIDE